MKKALMVSVALLLAGCAGAFLPIPAPVWEKGQDYNWNVHVEGSGSATFQEPGSPPETVPLPPTVFLEGTIGMTILDVINETFKWYPTEMREDLDFMPGEGDSLFDTDSTYAIAIRASDLAQANINVEDPFKLTPGAFYGGAELPIPADYEYREDLDPENPGLVTLVVRAGTTEDVSTPAGTFSASSLEWHYEFDLDEIIQEIKEEEGMDELSLSLNFAGTVWVSPETQFIVKSEAKLSGSGSASFTDETGTYKASGSGQIIMLMDLTSHGIVAVPPLESYFTSESKPVILPPVGDPYESTGDRIPTELVLSSPTVNAATGGATARVEGGGHTPEAAFLLYDLNGNFLGSEIGTEVNLPTDMFGYMYVVADVLDSEYADPALEIFGVEFDGEIDNGCTIVTVPVVPDCTGATFEVLPGLSEISATSESVGVHTLSISGPGDSDSNPGVLSATAAVNNPDQGDWTILGEGDVGTAVTVDAKLVLASGASSLDQAAFAQPVGLQQTPALGMESLFAAGVLPEWLPELPLHPDNGIALDRLVSVGIPLGSL